MGAVLTLVIVKTDNRSNTFRVQINNKNASKKIVKSMLCLYHSATTYNYLFKEAFQLS